MLPPNQIISLTDGRLLTHSVVLKPKKKVKVKVYQKYKKLKIDKLFITIMLSLKFQINIFNNIFNNLSIVI